MTGPFLSAVVDTLLPGDQGDPPLPTGTRVGIAAKLEQLGAGSDRAQRDVVLVAIASAAQGEDAFMRADAQARTATLRQVEATMPAPFRSVLAFVLREYYESDVVLVAMGWRAEPPQPLGHPLRPFDEVLLEPMRQRGRMWR